MNALCVFFFFPSDITSQDSLDGEPEVLLDPNALSEDGTVSLSSLSISKDAKYMAYGLSSSGSDWVAIKVMRIDDKKIEPDTLSWVRNCIMFISHRLLEQHNE